jgi:hypothetical protein
VLLVARCPCRSAYNWSTLNATTLPSSTCVLVDGPYLSVPAGCLSIGRRYAFTLRAVDNAGSGSWAQVRRKARITLKEPGH